jgi:hypothetical protein
MSSGLARDGQKKPQKVGTKWIRRKLTKLPTWRVATSGTKEIGVLIDSLLLGLGLTVRAVVGCRLVHHP